MNSIRLQWQERMRPALHALHAQWHASVFPGFLRWWGAELKTCLPPSLKRTLEQGQEEHVLLWREGSVWHQTPEGARPYKGTSAAGQRWVLVLGRGQALIKSLTLPPGAARDLATVLGFEMDRYTPFKAHQVYYAAQRSRGQPDQPMDITLVVAARETLDAHLQHLHTQGLHPVAVDVLTPGGDRMGVNLLPPARRPRQRDPRRLLNICLAALAVALVFTVLELWLYNREAALDSMRAEVARQRSATREVDELRQQLRNGLGAARYLNDRKQATTPLSAVLSELTHCLPLDTSLNELSVDEDGQVNLAGQSPHASTLISELKNCPSLTGAQFQGVIQPDEATAKERFYLLAHLRKNEEIRVAPAPVTP